MAKRQRRRKQPGRFRRNAGERSELDNSAIAGQRYDKDFSRMVAFASVRKPVVGYMSEARQRVFNLRKAEKDSKYIARFKGTPAGVHELRVKHADLTEEDQWADLYSSATICVKLFWKSNGQAVLRRYEAVSMTYRTSPTFGNSKRAKAALTEGRVNWSDPLPMILDD